RPPYRAAVPPGQRDRLQPEPAGRSQRLDHVGRRAAGADPERDVAFLPERLDLAREHALERVVVADARQHAGVGGQRDRGHRRALALEPAAAPRRGTGPRTPPPPCAPPDALPPLPNSSSLPPARIDAVTAAAASSTGC